ncbi:MAG: NUDIX hydrolase [Planctomycetaceae bacterium]|nr:NUDIX hydrolase [Planctomycetaceae bacterium]
MSEPALCPARDEPLDAGTSFLPLACSLDPRQVAATWSPQPAPALPADQQKRIDAAWEQALAKAARRGARLFDGPLCRLMDFSFAEGRLELHLSPTSYKQFVGTNRSDPTARLFGGTLADPLGVIALVLTSDGQILLGRRSKTVAEYPDLIHPVGGCLDWHGRDLSPGDAHAPLPDPLAALMTELEEETGVTAPHVSAAACIGLVRDKRTYQPEIVYDLTVDLDAAAIRQAALTAADAHEHTEMIAIPDDPVDLARFIETHLCQTTPATPGALLLHGRSRWGNAWFTSVRAMLRAATA